MSHPRTPGPNLPNNVATFTVPNQSSTGRINLRLVLKIIQASPGIADKVIPGLKVMKRRMLIIIFSFPSRSGQQLAQ